MSAAIFDAEELSTAENLALEALQRAQRILSGLSADQRKRVGASHEAWLFELVRASLAADEERFRLEGEIRGLRRKAGQVRTEVRRLESERRVSDMTAIEMAARREDALRDLHAKGLLGRDGRLGDTGPSWDAVRERKKEGVG
jgi:hypothetical protein